MIPAAPARIHLIPSKGSPYVLIIRRKPSKRFHVIRWNTKSDTLEYGSWFTGKLYPKRCDISFDGQWMVYLAMGATGETWNGISKAPFLRTVAESSNMGTWYGGGYWPDDRTVLLNGWSPEKGKVPFKTKEIKSDFGGEDLGVLYPRWRRDGWRRRGDNYGTSREIKNAKKYIVECDDDDGWEHMPSTEHPILTTKYLGYLTHGYTFKFELDCDISCFDKSVDSACWDSLGNLVYSREGVLYKYSLDDIRRGSPGSKHNLERIELAD